MAFGLPGSFPKSSSITTGGSCWKSNKCADNYSSSSFVTRASWHKNGKLSKDYCIKTSLQHNWKHHYKGIEGGYPCEKLEKKYFMNATSTPSDVPQPQAHNSKSALESIVNALDAFYKFSRLYAFIALALGALSSSLLAVENLSDLSPAFFSGFLQYMATYFFMHMYIVGVNQLADLEIDKINKPYLPLASGDYSYRNGAIIVASFLFMSFGLAWMIGSKPLLWSLFVNVVLMTAYSVNLPFLRWKKSTILTAVSNVISMLASYNLGSFFHMKTYVFKKAAIFPRSLVFVIMVMGIFYTVIILAKDIPDIEGDKAAGLETLAIRLGPKRVFWFCVSLLEIAYGVAIIMGVSSPFLWSKIVTVVAHAIMALILWYHANSVDLSSKVSLQSFYMVIFKLLYVENIFAFFVR